MDLFKKLVRANPVLLDLLTIKQKSVERKGRQRICRDHTRTRRSGQHGGKFDLLVIDEIHTQRDWNLLESLQPDPTRQSLTWITSYNSIYHQPGVPLFDMLKHAWAGTDARMYFSYYASDKTIDPDFSQDSGGAGQPKHGELDEQELSRPAAAAAALSQVRRLHLNLPGLTERSAFSAEKIEDAIERRTKVRPPQERVTHFGFVDMSGGSNDDACLGIAHKESGRAVLDLCINQVRTRHLIQ